MSGNSQRNSELSLPDNTPLDFESLLEQSEIRGNNEDRDSPEELQRLRQEVTELYDDIKHKQRLAKVQKDTNKTLEERQKHLTNRLKTYEERIKLLQNQFTEKKAEDIKEFSELINAATKKELDNLKAENENFEKIKQKREETISILEEKLQKTNSKTNDQSLIEQLQNKILQKDEEIEKLKFDFSKQIDEKNSQIEQLARAREDTSDRFASSSKLEALERKNDELSEQLLMKNSEMNELLKKVSSSQQKLSLLEKEKSSLNKTIDTLNKKINSLQTQIQNNINEDSLYLVGSSVLQNSVMARINLEESGHDDPQYFSRKQKDLLSKIERYLEDERPGYKMSFLNMIGAWAEFRTENICNSFEEDIQ